MPRHLFVAIGVGVKSNEENISEDYYNLTVVEYLKQGYNEDEAQVFALREMEEKFNIQIKEVTA